MKRISLVKLRPKGFTLVELLVSVGVFAFVMTITVGAYLVMLGANKQAQAVATATDNLSFALESVTRLIRTGSNYSCGASLSSGDCSSGGSELTFVDIEGRTVNLKVVNGAITQTITVGATPTVYALTESSVTITSLNFVVTGSDTYGAGDLNAPMVRAVITGTIPGVKNSTLSFTIQTSATMRGIDL